MNRKVAIMIIIAVVLSLAPGIVLLAVNSYFANPQKCEISNMKLTYAHGKEGYPQTCANFTVKNLYKSYVSDVDVKVNEIDYGLSTLQVNPGQTINASIPLENLTLSSSRNYDVRLTFTFADEQHETHFRSYATPEFKGQATVTNSSLVIYFNGYNNIGHFDLILENTGNLPIIEAKCTFWTSNPILSGYCTLPGEKIGFSDNCQLDSSPAYSYPATVQLTFLDGSTQTITTSVAVGS